MTVTITAKDRPNIPGAVDYTISGYSAEVVQREINRLFNQVDDFDGVAAAEFDNPRRQPDGSYLSNGYTYLRKETV